MWGFWFSHCSFCKSIGSTLVALVGLTTIVSLRGLFLRIGWTLILTTVPATSMMRGRLRIATPLAQSLNLAPPFFFYTTTSLGAMVEGWACEWSTLLAPFWIVPFWSAQHLYNQFFRRWRVASPNDLGGVSMECGWNLFLEIFTGRKSFDPHLELDMKLMLTAIGFHPTHPLFWLTTGN